MVPAPVYNLFGYFSAGLSILLLVVFNSTKFRRSRQWTIIVTPLASIIGSGFLVVAPLLYQNFGRFHLQAIVLINVFAIGLGWVVSTNIHHFEPLLRNGNAHTQLLRGMERASSLVLAIS